MPELPEVETIVADLRPRLVGHTIRDVEVGWPGAIGGLSPNEFASRLRGKRITDVGRRGKNILFWLSADEVLLLHLRMSGRLWLTEASELEPRFQRVAIELDDGRKLRFADLRKFGRLSLVPASEVAHLIDRLGPEPLGAEFTAEGFVRMLSSRRAQVKALLLDQSFVAGVGNIYADEALFAARIHPHRIAATLTKEEATRLHGALQAVLGQSIRNRGTTFSDYRDGRGRPGQNQDWLKVYRRTALPCPECGTPVQRLRFGGRGSHICPQCQVLDAVPPES
jgi:formamidopyrimidine-DNA glycosylase